MRKGRRFTLEGVTYFIDVIGPKTTLLIRDDGTFAHVDSSDLNRFLSVMEFEK